MIKPAIRDIFFLSQKTETATEADISVADDLLDTLKANAEGCTGLAANMIGIRKRYETVKIQWQTRDFKHRVKNFSDYTAQAIQHETDHCNGVVIL